MFDLSLFLLRIWRESCETKSLMTLRGLSVRYGKGLILG
jgi:hypothetical protein